MSEIDPDHEIDPYHPVAYPLNPSADQLGTRNENGRNASTDHPIGRQKSWHACPMSSEQEKQAW